MPANSLPQTAEEVRAILDGTRTAFSVAIKRAVQPPSRADRAIIHPVAKQAEFYANGRCVFIGKCPFFVGQKLFVRERWQMTGAMFGKPAGFAQYAHRNAYHYEATDEGQWKPYWGRWRGASTMPECVARLWLEITDVKAERDDAGVWQWVCQFKIADGPKQ